MALPSRPDTAARTYLLLGNMPTWRSARPSYSLGKSQMDAPIRQPFWSESLPCHERTFGSSYSRFCYLHNALPLPCHGCLCTFPGAILPLRKSHCLHHLFLLHMGSLCSRLGAAVCCADDCPTSRQTMVQHAVSDRHLAQFLQPQACFCPYHRCRQVQWLWPLRPQLQVGMY